MTPAIVHMEGVARLVPLDQAAAQADRLDELADALEGVSPQERGVALHLRGVATVLRCNHTERAASTSRSGTP